MGEKTSVHKGVWFDERSGGSWKAKAEIDGIRKTLGTFDTEKKAVLSYCRYMVFYYNRKLITLQQ